MPITERPVNGLSEMVICDKQPNAKRKSPERVARTRRKLHAKAWSSSLAIGSSIAIPFDWSLRDESTSQGLSKQGAVA